MSNDKLRGTKTEQNLINSFAGESQARNRYTYFAKIAQKEGYEQIADVFLQTAENEKVHAKQFYKYIGSTCGHVNASYPFEFGTTIENLKSAIGGEHEEAYEIYTCAAQTAKDEGFDDIAETFHNIINAEKHHEKRYRELLEVLENKTIFRKEAEVDWMCRKCAYIHHDKSAPDKCPACNHARAYFQLLCEKY